ncbi:MAG: enoyl-CoA hydratase/isomerase family protein [Deltaproteobacteria bacterium]|nr:enoyl-CoA hydratase/isomerase family protein [Deltaproteobacteria bacterium]
MYQTLTYVQEGGVATIGLNRPESLNGFNLDMGKDLSECLTHCSIDKTVKAILFKGEGKVFSAGGDVKEMKQASDRPYTAKIATMYLNNIISTIWRMPKPIIAAVHGAVTGASFAMVLACDVIIAAEGTRFGTAYLAIGLSPDGGTSFFLPKVMGFHRAKYFAFASEMIDAAAGQQLGFVSKVVKSENLIAEAAKIAGKLASGPAWAIGKTKELLNSSFTQTLESQLESESNELAFAMGTADFEEGFEAFLAKRSPKFKG